MQLKGSGAPSIHVKMLTSLSLCRSSCELMCVAAMSHPEDRISYRTPPPPAALTFFPLHLPECSLNLGGRVLQMSHTELSTQRSLILKAWSRYESQY